jgi:hypothetical protein
MTEPGLLLLIDSEWRPTPEEPDPPMEALLGAWEVVDGAVGRFQPNPVYRPLMPNSPLDPVDAVLRHLPDSVGDLPSVLRTTTLGIALDGQGVALVQPAPDGVPAVLVATSHGHRNVPGVPRWADITVRQLATALPVGVDVLLNPAGPAPMRLLASAIRNIAAQNEDG